MYQGNYLDFRAGVEWVRVCVCCDVELNLMQLLNRPRDCVSCALHQGQGCQPCPMMLLKSPTSTSVCVHRPCVPRAVQCHSLPSEAELSTWHYRMHSVPPLVLVLLLDRFSMYLWLPNLCNRSSELARFSMTSSMSPEDLVHRLR